MDEQVKSKRLCRSICLRERHAVQLCQKAGRMVAGDVDLFFFLLLEMRDLNKLTSKLELWRRECLILVNISMFCNRGKNLLAETYLQSFLVLLHC